MKHNLVARNCRKFNRAAVMTDRKKQLKLGRKPKHKASCVYGGRFDSFPPNSLGLGRRLAHLASVLARMATDIADASR